MRYRTLTLLALLLVLCPGAVHAEEEKPRLALFVFGPEETGYPFATFQGSAAKIPTLHFRARDEGDKELFAFTAKDGSTLILEMQPLAGEDQAGCSARTSLFVEHAAARLKAAGFFDTRIHAETGGRIRVEIPAHSIDGGAPIAALLTSSGSIELRPEVGPSRAHGWPGTKAEYLAFKKAEAKAWRERTAAGRAPHPSRPGQRLVRRMGHNGSQTYHFKLVEENDAVAAFDRRLFSKVEVLDSEDDGWLLHLTWGPGARAKFDTWRKALGDRPIALLLHGEHYAELEDEDITNEALSLPLRTWSSRPTAAWAEELAQSLLGPALPGRPRLLARVNYEAGEAGSFQFLAPMSPESSMSIEASAPGETGIASSEATRRHKPGHFAKFYFITMSFLGGRHCNNLAVEQAVWKKYQEMPTLTFNVGITLTHFGTSPLAIMAGSMLGRWRDDPSEVMRRLLMGLKMKQAERRWAAVRGIALRATTDHLTRAAAHEHLATALDDENERVRVAAALARRTLGAPADRDTAVLTQATSSKDPWVLWALKKK